MSDAFWTGLFTVPRAIAWPIVSGILVWLLRNHITATIPGLRSVVDRTRKFRAKAGPVELEMEAVAAQKSAPNADPSEIVLRDIPDTSRSPALATLERQIHSHVPQIEEEMRVHVLVSALAHARLQAAFGLIFARIFGSQIQALRLLKERGTVSIQQARRYFEEEVRPIDSNLYEAYTFDQWLQFLQQTQLINLQGEALALSDIGKDFLPWLEGTTLANIVKPY